jgi:hypothetical protein
MMMDGSFVGLSPGGWSWTAESSLEAGRIIISNSMSSANSFLEVDKVNAAPQRVFR